MNLFEFLILKDISVCHPTIFESSHCNIAKSFKGKLDRWVPRSLGSVFGFGCGCAGAKICNGCLSFSLSMESPSPEVETPMLTLLELGESLVESQPSTTIADESPQSSSELSHMSLMSDLVMSSLPPPLAAARPSVVPRSAYDDPEYARISSDNWMTILHHFALQ